MTLTIVRVAGRGGDDGTTGVIVVDLLDERGLGLEGTDAFLRTDELAEEPNFGGFQFNLLVLVEICLLYTSPSPRDRQKSRMPSSA